MSSSGPRVMIATPCYGGMVLHSYVQSMVDTIIDCSKHGIGIMLATMGNESLITRARNSLAAQFLASDATHLLFIDADVTWHASAVRGLVERNKAIVGGIYPMKAYDFSRSEEAYQESHIGGEFYPDLFQAKLLDYPVSYLDGQKELAIKDGLARVKHIPTGFMMIKRGVFLDLIKGKPGLGVAGIQKLTQDANRDQSLADCLYNFFDCMVSPTTGAYLSEDYAFCQRWLGLDPDNNEIYADLRINLYHSGMHTFKGNYGASLQNQD